MDGGILTRLWPAFVMVILSLLIVFKKGPFNRVHRLAVFCYFLLALIIALGVFIHIGHHYDNLLLTFLLAFVISLFPPSYFLFMRELSDIRGLRNYDVLMYIPSIIIIIAMAIVGIAFDHQHSQTLSHSFYFGIEPSHAEQCGLCCASHVLKYIYLLVPIQFVFVQIYAIKWARRYLWILGELCANTDMYIRTSEKLTAIVNSIGVVCLITYIFTIFSSDMSSIKLYIFGLCLVFTYSYDAWIIIRLQFSATQLRDMLLDIQHNYEIQKH